MPRFFHKMIGPRVPAHELEHDAGRYRAPTIFFWLARLALLISIFVPRLPGMAPWIKISPVSGNILITLRFLTVTRFPPMRPPMRVPLKTF